MLYNLKLVEPSIKLEEFKSGVDILKLAKNPDKINSMSSADIRKDLDNVSRNRRESKKLLLIDIKPGDVDLNEMKKTLKYFFSSLIEEDPEINQKIEEIRIDQEKLAALLNFNNKTNPYLQQAVIALAMLSFYTSHHAINARYPDKDKNFSPLRFHNKKFSLIKVMPELFSIQKSSIKCMKEFIELNNKLGITFNVKRHT